MSDIYVHNLSPFLIQFTETIGVRWYGLSYLAGFLLAWASIVWMANRSHILVSADRAADLVTYAAIGTLVGGRLGYCIFYSPELFTTFHGQFPYWGVFEVHKGGMASHGGIIGIAAGCMLFGWRDPKKPSMAHMIDLVCFGGTLGVFFGRIANFINGELYGRECPSTFAWAVKFPQEIYRWGGAELEKLKGLGPAVEALGVIPDHAGQTLQATKDTWLLWVSSMSYDAQIKIDLFKEALVKATQDHNAAVIAALGPVLTPRYPSQLFQAFLEGLFVFILLFIMWRKPQKPGVISATFGVCYAVTRIIGEQYRLPDAHIGFQWLGLTRGQWLSVLMLLVTTTYLVYVVRRPAEKFGGWLEGSPDTKKR